MSNIYLKNDKLLTYFISKFRSNFASLPPPRFVRIGYVEIVFDEQTIVREYVWVQSILLQLQQNIANGAKIKISFVQNGLQQNLELKKIFHHKLLSNFTNCNSYEFSISSNATATDFIVYLLEFQPISGSSNVVIGSSFLPAELPVETIANWLDRPIKRAQKVRPNFLRLRMNLILNPVEIFNHLKEVGNFALLSCTFICKNFYSCYVIVQKLCTSSEPENMLMRSFGFKHANYKNYYFSNSFNQNSFFS